MRKLNSKPGQPEYEALANSLARDYMGIYPCVTCGYPALQNRLCINEKCKCMCGGAIENVIQCTCEWEKK